MSDRFLTGELQEKNQFFEYLKSHVVMGCTGEGNGNPLQYILAWRIPWTEHPGRLWSMGSQSQTQLSN